jgi:hypothetical protein
MAKYIIRVSSVSYAYAETEIEAESEEAAEDIAWEQLSSGELELEQSHGDMEVDVQETEDE